jgi:hypothetical protein
MIAPFRILVVANKRWEVDPVVGVLLEKKARPAAFDAVALEYHPAMRNPAAGLHPRAIASCHVLLEPGAGRQPPAPSAGTAVAEVQVWCVQDAMRTRTTAGSPISDSSTREKAVHALPALAAAIRDFVPDVVVAIGTAGIVATPDVNGSVTVGSRIFVSDPFQQHPEEMRQPGTDPELWMWDAPDGALGVVHDSRVSPGFLGSDRSAMRRACEGLLLSPPLRPARTPVVLMGEGLASLGTVNVTNYDDYAWADADTVVRYRGATRRSGIGSVETTHGLIRLQWRDQPFLFVSGITDAVGAFDLDVGPRAYAQNFAAAHNAGVVVAHLVPEILAAHAANALLR